MKSITRYARPLAAAAGIAAMTVAMPAYAADVVFQEPPAPAVPMELPPLASWAGPYVGVFGGYAFGGTAEREVLFGPNIDMDGFTGGAFAGYNWQAGSFVYGLEADIGYNGADGFSFVGPGGFTATRAGLEGSLRARMGFAATDRFLIYATAGGAATDFNVLDGAGTTNETMLGYTVGAGVEALVTDNMFTRLEYRYSDYGSETFNTGSGPQSISYDDHRVQVGIGFKF